MIETFGQKSIWAEELNLLGQNRFNLGQFDSLSAINPLDLAKKPCMNFGAYQLG